MGLFPWNSNYYVAICNTARTVHGAEIFASGHGLLQVCRAYEYLKHHRDYEPLDLRYEVSFDEV